MFNNKIWLLLCCAFLAITTTSCEKFLDTKPSESLATPSTLKDLRALMDDPYFGRRGAGAMNTQSDEYWLQYTSWQVYSTDTKNLHIWDGQTDYMSDWNKIYLNVLTTNTVLDHLKKIDPAAEPEKYNALKGEALVHRAQCYFAISQIYAPQYDPATANSDLGIVLREDADFNKPSIRSTVKQTYDQMINDIGEAATLLPEVSAYKTRPNKPAAYGFLARLYLQIGNYAKAKENADKCLAIYDDLINYNDPAEVDTLLNEPFKKLHINNKEVIFYMNEDASITISSRAVVDTSLYNLYEVNDIRRAAFFRNSTRAPGYKMYKGSYNGSVSRGNFIGVGTAEVYLIRAEANARLGNKDAALLDLNALLVNRYKTGTFTPVTTATAEEALDIILRERRKEMAFRGLRWSDLRRLNKEPGRATTLKRILNGQEYILPPNDYRYTLLIPSYVMQLAPGIIQNPR